MKTMNKPYKHVSKQNRKKKVLADVESGQLTTNNSNKRFPVIALPEIVTVPIMQSYRRFIATAAVNSSISIQNCLDQFLMAQTATLASCYIEAVRIKKVRFLSPVTTQGTSVTLQIKPVGQDASDNNFNSLSEVFLDTSASIDVPAYVSLVPSLDTPFGSWHYANTVNSTLLEMICPSGTTMDILFEFILRNRTSGASGFTRALAGAIPGMMYARAISSFNPVGVNII